MAISKIRAAWWIDMLEIDLLELLEKFVTAKPEFVAKRCLLPRAPGSNCELCFTNCPVDAIIRSYTLSIDEDKCIGCGVCWQVCPTEAWTFPYDPEKTLSQTISSLKVSSIELICPRREEQEGLLSPATVVVNVKKCLAALSLPLLLEAVAAGAQKVWLNDEACEDCPLGSLHKLIEAQARKANVILQAFGRDNAFFLRLSVSKEEEPELHEVPIYPGDKPFFTRRDAFSFLRKEAYEMAEEALRKGLQSLFGPMAGDAAKHLPQQHRRLIRTLLRLGEPADLEVPAADVPFGLVEISDDCTACGACARACPTGALIFESDGKAFRLDFVPLACIGCGICSLMCPTEALRLRETFSFADLFKSVRITVQQGILSTCEKCGTRFKSAGSETLCRLCRQSREPGRNLAG